MLCFVNLNTFIEHAQSKLSDSNICPKPEILHSVENLFIDSDCHSVNEVN